MNVTRFWKLSGVLAVALVALTLAGCQTKKLPSVYIAPRVYGRVLDAQTQQPVADVRVQRVRADESYRAMETAKGGQKLDLNPSVRTDADGKFALASARDVALLRQIGWYSVSISFENLQYERLVKTYTLTNATLNASGEPEVNAGDVKLVRRAK